MAEQTRLAKLPGYDTAPDVYETPELTDDTSTTLQTSSPSPSDGSDDEDTESQDDTGVSRRRLNSAYARSKFQAVGSRVETKGLDLSDRVDGRRRGFRVRRRRVGEDDGVEESLEERIARLRREVEECRVIVEEGKAEPQQGDKTIAQGVDGLGKLLAELETKDVGKRQGQRGVSAIPNGASEPPGDHSANAADEPTLGKIAAFDARLTSLERALGISSLDMAPDGTFTSPVLPSLDLLDQQMSTLMSSTSLTSIDAASSRIKKLSQEAEQLRQQQIAPGSGNEDDSGVEGASPALSQDDISKLNTLYGLLPSLQSLSPIVPALLERLRSLRALHTGAANAASELDELERRQAEMDVELASWRDGLKKLDGVVQEAGEANGRNGKVVQGWVKDLEARMKALSGQ